MIYSISADRPSFKGVTFKDGLNVILATRTKKSSKKDSTNGLGKSTLMDILHYCLGADRYGALSNRALEGWTFTMTLDIRGRVYSVSRTVAKNAKIHIVGDCSDWPIQPNTSGEKQSFTIVDWKTSLGYMMYGLDFRQDTEYSPTFRSLISYFARRDSPGGYGSGPFQNNSRQLTWDVQVNNAYLLGLDWSLASKKQVLRDRINAQRLLKKKTVEATIGEVIGEEADMESVRIRLADEIEKQKERIDAFRIHDMYHNLEVDADKMTVEMHDMENQNISDKRILDLYRASMVEETDADPTEVARIYKDVGLLFPDAVTNRLEDVQQFHKNIVRNRRDYLSSEIDRLNDSVRKRDQKIQEIGIKKARIMNILDSHGALDEFHLILEEHQTKVAELEDVTNRLKILRDVSNEKDAIKLDSTRLLQQMKSDLAERQAQWAEAVKTFNSYSNRLYNKPGTLSIGASESGYIFGVRIERADSHGYKNMKIFCYDLTLAMLWARRQTSPGFLMHDSVMFADVDKRQVAHAIRLADAGSRRHQYQYICMLNSDSIPWDELGPDFDFNAHVSVSLTDATEEGSLLGIRF